MILTREFVADYRKIGYDSVITTKNRPTWFGKLFGIKETSERYRGSCTVWHRVSDGRRCSSERERWFADVWTYREWERKRA